MEKSRVAKVKLGTPPEGFTSIVFTDGIRERTMLVEAGDDWVFRVSIDSSTDDKKTYCLAISGDGSEFSVTKMVPRGALPETVRFKSSDSGIRPLDMDQNEVIEIAKDKLDG